MLADTGILPKKTKYRCLFPLNLLRSGVCLSLLIMLAACTTNISSLETAEKNTQQSGEDTSGQVPSSENSANDDSSPQTNVNQASKASVPAPQPAPSGKQAVPLQQTAMIDGEKANIKQAMAVPPQNPANQQTQKQAIEEQQTSKKTALFPFGRKKESAALIEPQANETVVDQPPATDAITQNPASNNNAQQKTLDEGKTPPPPQPSLQQDNASRQAPQRDATSQKKGSLMRLFGHSESEKTNKLISGETKTALVPLPKKDPHEYNDVLPGVRPNGGIVIKHRTSLYDDTDIDANEIDSPSLYTLASVSIYGRSLPNGLKIARKDVEVSCLKPQLVTILKTIERRFNKPVIITSGYRSPSYNQKVNGAKRSMHMSCAAADIQVPDTNKWDVAKFVRTLPNRGGVGTYCHQSIHVDVGPKRDWNWSCSAKN